MMRLPVRQPVRLGILRGLVLWLKFDEGTGRKVYDLSQWRNHGTIHGATWTQGKFGKALSFDGVDDYVDCGKDVIDATGTITFECWFKSNDISAAQGIASIVNTGYDYSTGKNYLVVGIFNSRVQATAAGSLESSRWSSVLQSNTWYHLVVIKVPGDIDKIYINGVEDTHSSDAHWGGDVSTVIGKVDVATDRYLKGTIDEVRIYNRALSEEEIKRLYWQVVRIMRD